ncbi:MAG: TIGR00159 family protein [Planctomycetales bacterium]|nr:diadenylate cyclase CdaA [bacterium]UNM07909.1 MAG: TIGR00159 family protein [Planctomycetales bacterium]
MEATFAWILRNVGQIVDVLAVAILFYYILIYARGTKVMLVVQGILVMSGFYFLCQYLKLITLVFIMDAVFTVGPLAIFILFVPEIRKVLESAGRRSRLFSIFTSDNHISENSSLVEVLTSTVYHFAQKRIGALIVLAVNDKLDEFIVPGTVIDGIPSERLISSLFDRHNPLHDGAIIMLEGRVHSAGNFLPMTEVTFLASELGTRHRAAVGLTERCDAIVIVVSEERGEVSISHSGRLARRLGEEQFVEQLNALLEPNENFASNLTRAALN